MNLPRSSILRLMVAVALIDSALGVLRRGDRVQMTIGELTPALTIGLLGVALDLITQRTIRRFFVGSAIFGVVLSLAIVVAPLSFREAILHRFLIPIDHRFHERFSGTTWSKLEISLVTVSRTPSSYGYHLTRPPFVSRKSQIALGWLELTMATIFGAIFVIPSPYSAYLKLSNKT